MTKGPIDNSRRSCTNVFCAFIYALILLSVIAIGIYGHKIGDINLIDRGYDPDRK